MRQGPWVASVRLSGILACTLQPAPSSEPTKSHDESFPPDHTPPRLGGHHPLAQRVTHGTHRIRRPSIGDLISTPWYSGRACAAVPPCKGTQNAERRRQERQSGWLACGGAFMSNTFLRICSFLARQKDSLSNTPRIPVHARHFSRGKDSPLSTLAGGAGDNLIIQTLCTFNARETNARRDSPAHCLRVVDRNLAPFLASREDGGQAKRIARQPEGRRVA